MKLKKKNIGKYIDLLLFFFFQCAIFAYPGIHIGVEKEFNLEK